MTTKTIAGPNQTAVRVALWRALHVLADKPPHVLYDDLGIKLIAPSPIWRRRPDMAVQGTRRARASIVGRARLIEDLVLEEAAAGTAQYVLLGAGLDTFAQRRSEEAPGLRIFELDEPIAQDWKRRRLGEVGATTPPSLHFVPVDFEAQSWWDVLNEAGFDAEKPAVIASTGVSMYLTDEANEATLRQAAQLAKGSVFVMTFMLPLDLLEVEERTQLEATRKFTQRTKNPFRSFYSPAGMVKLARKAGLKNVQHISHTDLGERYFSQRTDGLWPSSSEGLLIART